MPLPPLATLDQLEDWLQVPRGSAPENTVNLALAIASDMVRREARQTFTVRTSTLSVRIDDGRIMLAGPVLSVDSVEVADTALTEGTDWELDGDTICLASPCRWRTSRRARVTWEHGMEVVPLEVVGLVLDVTARACVNPKNLRQESTGQRSVTFASETLATSLAQVEIDKLARYRPQKGLTSRWGR
ncbi:hypothetical protein [Streptomyces scabiei]|uniref:hypothetical protein n=1 Tax=Streptomyces scabiei TaxID=1930 RepID=UPI0029AB04FA|nr:hypothetical protein [Streptomyces scabiei]MDX2538587.1 hypothetical protein [Streptomyces scabiei]MDX2799861.1 hypothetical protein [Streptomyces scabiei]MDX2855542.1 hypothetical protein [Streptomyces scabiei]MDX3278060.1 hypothetical protein [Streptomyces scabiei]MDX3828516.1 hypothetical protein [Streptomyces scabiei]